MWSNFKEMKLNKNWEKMKATTVLSVIENNRRKKEVKNEKYSVYIENEVIFNDLEFVFFHIDGFRNLYIKLFEDMSKFDFINTSSVTDSSDNLISNHGTTMLYKHLFNTFREMVEILKRGNSSLQKDIFYLLALLHDFGKSHELCNHYNIDLSHKHHVRSALYFESIIEEEDDRFGMDTTSFLIILKNLKEHHSMGEKSDDIFMEKLKIADRRAREFEKEGESSDS